MIKKWWRIFFSLLIFYYNFKIYFNRYSIVLYYFKYISQFKKEKEKKKKDNEDLKLAMEESTENLLLKEKAHCPLAAVGIEVRVALPSVNYVSIRWTLSFFWSHACLSPPLLFATLFSFYSSLHSLFIFYYYSQTQHFLLLLIPSSLSYLLSLVA